MTEPDDYARYEAWSAMNQLEPEKWICEYCRKRGEGDPPMKSQAGFTACCESHAACLDYLDTIDENITADYRDVAVFVGVLVLGAMILSWGGWSW